MNIRRLFSSLSRNSRHPPRRLVSLRLEELEARRLLSVTPLGDDDLSLFPAEIAPAVTLNHTTLQITGTAGDDWVEIAEAGNTVTVQIYDAMGQTLLATHPFSKSAVSQITFYGNAGDDTFKNWSRDAGPCTIDCLAYGGAGNDYLQGGAGRNTLDGNDGDNMLVGGRGVNVFVNEGYGSSAFIWCGTADSWAAGSSNPAAGSDDAKLLFYTTDRQGINNYKYAGHSYTYLPWSDDAIFSVIDSIALTYGIFGNYRFATSGNYADNAVYFNMVDVDRNLFVGLNVSNRGIQFNGIPDADTVIHELAHNWQYGTSTNNANGNTAYTAFFAISWYSSTTLKSGNSSVHDFAPHYVPGYTYNVYSTSNSMEDWATAMSFTLRSHFPPTPSAKWHEKVEQIWDFVYLVNPGHEARSVVVTTELDVLDANDGLVSLREAILYADTSTGMTVTFAENIRGKTITLAGESLFVGKNITIDATGMGITIDAANRSGLLETNAPAITLIGLDFTGAAAEYAFSTRGSITFDRCRVYNNTTTKTTLFNWRYGIHNGTEYVLYDGEINILHTSFYDNITGTNSVIYASATGQVNIINSVIAANTGLAAQIHNSSAVITNSTIAANGSTSGDLGSIYFDAAGKTLTINNSILADCGSTYDLQLRNGTIKIFYSLVGARSPTTVYTADGHSLVGTTGNRAAAGFFAVARAGAWAEQDLRLRETSFARGTGSVALAAGIPTDILGNPRTQYGVIDMGAYQTQQPPPLPDEPDELTATSAADGRMTVYWAPVTGAASYRAQYHAGDGVWNDAEVIGTCAVLVNLAGNTTYAFRVCSVNAAGQSDWNAMTLATEEKFNLAGVLTTQRSDPEATTAPASEPAIHEWQPFFLELWTPAGEYHRELVVEYDANLYTVTTSGAIAADGVRLEFTDFELNEATGKASFRVTVLDDGTPAAPQAGQSTRLAAIPFAPATEAVSANAPGVPARAIYRDAAVESWLAAGGANVTTNVWAVPYDLSDHGEINIYDLIQFAKVYDGNAAANPAPDFNGDGAINIYDLILLAKQFGLDRKTGADITVPRMDAAMSQPLVAPIPYCDTGLLYWVAEEAVAKEAVPEETAAKEASAKETAPELIDYIFETAAAEESQETAAPMFQAFTASGVFQRKRR